MDEMNPLAAYLTKHGLSHRELAVEAGVPAPMVSLWARGIRKPGLANALKLERVTKIPAAFWAAMKVAKAKRRRTGQAA